MSILIQNTIMSNLAAFNHIPSSFYSVFLFETKTKEETIELFENVYLSCSDTYKFHRNKEQLEKSLKTLNICNTNIYGSILFDGESSIKIVSFSINENKQNNCIFINNKDKIKSAIYSGTIKGILYTGCLNYKEKTQQEFNIYTDIHIKLSDDVKQENKKQLKLI